MMRCSPWPRWRCAASRISNTARNHIFKGLRVFSGSVPESLACLMVAFGALERRALADRPHTGGRWRNPAGIPCHRLPWIPLISSSDGCSRSGYD
jgi:hypothetical protein